MHARQVAVPAQKTDGSESRPYSTVVIRWVDERNRTVNSARIENSFLLVNHRQYQAGSVICVVQNRLVSQFEG